MREASQTFVIQFRIQIYKAIPYEKLYLADGLQVENWNILIPEET